MGPFENGADGHGKGLVAVAAVVETGPVSLPLSRLPYRPPAMRTDRPVRPADQLKMAGRAASSSVKIGSVRFMAYLRDETNHTLVHTYVKGIIPQGRTVRPRVALNSVTVWRQE